MRLSVRTSKRTALVYALAGVGGNVLPVVLKGMSDSALSVGASGAVAGLVGALAVHLYRHSHLYGTSGLKSIRDTVLMNAALGMTSHNVDNRAIEPSASRRWCGGRSRFSQSPSSSSPLDYSRRHPVAVHRQLPAERDGLVAPDGFNTLRLRAVGRVGHDQRQRRRLVQNEKTPSTDTRRLHPTNTVRAVDHAVRGKNRDSAST